MDSGGMGQVYRAIDRYSGNEVALKIARPHIQEGGLDNRLLREAKLLSELRHPGFVHYIAHGITKSGRFYLAMEWLDGESLATRLEHGPLSVEHTLVVVERVSSALAMAHSRGVIHRDLKPSNLFLPGYLVDRVKILDFGVARIVGSSSGITKPGEMVGTPSYMAPEQLMSDEGVDARVDVYSLGCLIYECIAGGPPFVGEDVMAVMLKILHETAPRLQSVAADVPGQLDDLVLRMLSKRRGERPSDADAVAHEIASIREVLGTRSEPLRRLRTITSSELSLLSVILASVATEGATDPATATTVLAQSPPLPMEQLRELAERFDAPCEFLAPGIVAIILRSASAATDLAERAARCALAVRALIPEAVLALATGRAEVARDRHQGEVIDRAVRMLRAATSEQARGAVRIDEVTVGLLSPRFDITGTDASLELREVRENQTPLRTLLGQVTPCVGRSRELRMLESVLDECEAESVAQAVLVTGPPGIGKSRLRYEFLGQIEKREHPVEILLGRGEPLNAGAPLGLLAMAIRRAAGVRDGEPPAVQRKKLAARIGRHLERDQNRIIHFVGELAGLSQSDEQEPFFKAAREAPVLMAEQMARAWQDWLAAECTSATVLLVLEDLHWGDLPTVQFVDRALRDLSNASFTVLATARPEVAELFPDIWAGRGVTHMHLHELSRRAATQLVRGVLGNKTPGATVDRLVELAQGNAFYLEELIRAVADGRADDLPATVLAMVQARLERLPPAARRILRAASIFGTSFWPGGLGALIGSGEQELGGWLIALESEEIIVRRTESKFPDQEEYVFRHPLFVDASYEMLTEADRELGHRLAGAWLERVGESEATVLAEHYERGNTQERAAHWLLRAGQRALSEGSPELAAKHFEKATRFGVEDKVLPRLAEMLTKAYRYLGRFDDAIAWLDHHLDASPATTATRASLLATKLHILSNVDNDEVLRVADETLHALQVVGNWDAYAFVLHLASHAAYWRGDTTASQRFAQVAEGQVQGSEQARFHVVRAQECAAAARRDLEEQIQLATEARDIAMAVGDLGFAANESNNIAEALLDLGYPKRAWEAALRGAEMARTAGYSSAEIFSGMLAARARGELGDIDDAIARMGHLAQIYVPPLLIEAVLSRAFFLLARGTADDIEVARKQCQVALDIAENARLASRLTGLLALLASAQHRATTGAGPSGAARETLSRAAAYADSAGAPSIYLLALACCEILPAENPERTARLADARSRLLAEASVRVNPGPFCSRVRLHRLVLEASGGIPAEFWLPVNADDES